jgi:hypothetical protein
LPAASVAVQVTTVGPIFRVRFAKASPLQTSTREQWIDMLLLGIDVPPLGSKPTPSGWRGVDCVLGVHGARGASCGVLPAASFCSGLPPPCWPVSAWAPPPARWRRRHRAG